METEEVELASCQVTLTAAAQESLALQALLQRVLPMLRRPGSFTREERSQLAQNIRLFLDGELEETDLFGMDGTREDGEPGAWQDEEPPI